MHLSRLTVRNFRQFGSGADELELRFEGGITALIGRNDSGKSAVIDAIRHALLTRDQNSLRLQPDDFHIDRKGAQADDILVRCQLSDLSDSEKGALAEYLSYDGGDATVFVHWAATRRSGSDVQRRWVDVSVRSGRDGNGPPFEASIRELLASTYLRPLRDAAREMSPGRNSRLSQILANVPDIAKGESFNEAALPVDAKAVAGLSLLGLADYLRYSVKNHEGVSSAEKAINSQYLSSLLLSGDRLHGRIDLTEGGTDRARLRHILERLELGLLDELTRAARGQYGLGSNNVLYMACELLLLGREPDGLPLLLIEEPEAHLHPQRQLRLMDFLSSAAAGKVKDSPRSVQVILSTHSPNLASTIPLRNLVILEHGQAFPLAPGCTELATGDYKFLERFLDVTKANLFFSHGVLIVEGDAEALLMPVIARLIGADLTEHGVSIVNVGGTGLRRYGKIFQRSAADVRRLLIPVACVTDLDVMPDCAPEILGIVTGDADEAWKSTRRRWKAERDVRAEGTLEEGLAKRRERLCASDAQSVKTFVSPHWTLEFGLAFCGLAKEVHIAASLANADDAINAGKKSIADVTADAAAEFLEMETACKADRAVLCSRIYRPLYTGSASKAITAQYLAGILEAEEQTEEFDRAKFESRLPAYLVAAIGHACGLPGSVTEGATPEASVK